MLSSNQPTPPAALSPQTSTSSAGSEVGSNENTSEHKEDSSKLLQPPIPTLSSASAGDLAIAMDGVSLDDRPPVPESDLELDDEVPHLTGPPDDTVGCEGCKMWEEKFKALQKEHISVSNRLSATVADLHTVKKALEQAESRARAEKNLFEEQTSSFEQRIEQLNQRLDRLLKDYQAYRRSTESEFARLEQERLTAQMELSEVEEHYRTLLGKRRDAAAEMSAPIDLPSAKEDLELYALQMREELLSTNVACEHLRKRLDTEMTINQDKLNEERNKRIMAEKTLRQLTLDANERITELTKSLEVAQASAAAKQAVEKAAERAAADVKRHKIELLEKDKALKRVREEAVQLRAKVASLQVDLENTEKVSMDFVRLSQHLQVQLERQREQTHEVRWQEPDDVHQCAGCLRPFESGRAVKQNCRHCGGIFCPACLTKVIPPSGTRSRPALVCDMCHTLLVKDAAPYFSTGDFHKVDGNEEELS
ncbi:hypothetical protein Aperf_G00000085464 [Anoplocephala perfoliata]